MESQERESKQNWRQLEVLHKTAALFTGPIVHAHRAHLYGWVHWKTGFNVGYVKVKII